MEPQQMKDLTPQTQVNSVSYNNIELTEEELNIAIREAKKAKYFKLKNQAYFEDLKKEREYPKYTPEELFAIITKTAKEQMGEFNIDDHNKPIIEMLCQYFTESELFETTDGFSLKKGLFLYGNIGCGKTSIMRLFQQNQVSSYAIVSCRKVASTFSEEGYEGIERYYGTLPTAYNVNPFGHDRLGICFDDLGTENNKKHYGNESNVMAEILLNRYDNLRALQNKTHITTNLTSEEIETYYGNRVKSRLREMFNLIAFPKASPDRRK